MLPRPELRYHPLLDKFELLKPFITSEMTVPAGFFTDGISSPWFMRWAVSRVGPGLSAAIVHDYCYDEALQTKEWADDLFLTNLKRCGVPFFKRKAMYWGVRFGGRGSY